MSMNDGSKGQKNAWVAMEERVADLERELDEWKRREREWLSREAAASKMAGEYMRERDDFRARVAELERQSEQDVEVNRILHERIAELEQALERSASNES